MDNFTMNHPVVWLFFSVVVLALAWLGKELLSPWTKRSKWFRRVQVWWIARRTRVDVTGMIQGYQQILDLWRQSGNRLEILLDEVSGMLRNYTVDTDLKSISTSDMELYLRALNEHLKFEQCTLSVIAKFKATYGVFTVDKVNERIRIINHFRDIIMPELERRKVRKGGSDS